jgi:DNA polymerase-1
MKPIKESSQLDWEDKHIENNPTFGPALYGVKLHINEPKSFELSLPLVFDVETDEKDNFVGIAFTQDGKDIYYSTELPITMPFRLIGHNLKGDMKWLINWGVNIRPKQLYYDTMLASYVQNTTKESQGLKELAKEYLGMEWPSYKEMVGKGKSKQTLDKQEVGRVAAYCGMDCLATYRLYEYFTKKLTITESKYLQDIELPTTRALLDMELLGVQVDVNYLKELDHKFDQQKAVLENEILRQFQKYQPLSVGTKININSNLQIAKLLQSQGAVLPKTQKGNFKVDKQTLEAWRHLPVVPLLLEHSKIEKLKSTYTESLLEKQNNGRIYCSFNQLSRDIKGNTFGISTGRLSSSNPNLQNIPARTEEGCLLRKAFVSGTNKVFIDADFSQIEPRLVAHFTKDKTFVETYKNDRDIYQELVEGTGRNRQDGKTFMLALLYGAQPKKLSSVFKCSEKEAENIVETIMGKLPGVTAWINRVKWEARQKKGVKTLFGRWIPLPKINDGNKYERMHWERVAVNSIIQGSAAEIMKKSLIALNEAGYKSVLTVHDEFLIEVHEDLEGMPNMIETASNEIQRIMESIIKLEVPLKVDVGIGNNWFEAKE